MNNLTVEIIPDLEQGGFTARVPDIPAYGEGKSEEEAITDLREALAAYIETFGIDDALVREGKFDPQRAAAAIRELGLDPEAQDRVTL